MEAPPALGVCSDHWCGRRWTMAAVVCPVPIISAPNCPPLNPGREGGRGVRCVRWPRTFDRPTRYPPATLTPPQADPILPPSGGISHVSTYRDLGGGHSSA